MKRKVVTIFNLILLILVFVLCLRAQAVSKITITSDASTVEKDEEFNIRVNADNTNIAAFTIWIYFDNDKLECVSNQDNVNVLDNRIIYMWFSDTGKNKSLDNLLELKFKAKENGIASFSVIGEFYNEKGEEIDTQYSNLDINIGGENEVAEKLDLENENASLSADNANLDIMRLGYEGINPDFSPDIQEYYLIVDEDTENIDVTAIPENRDAQVKVSGNSNLKNGKNTIKIKVASADKTNVKNYVVNVTKTNNSKRADANLETLAVEGYELNPEFYDNITHYKIEVSKDTTNLNVLAIPSSMNASVSIKGNENLDYGNNDITITVTAEDNITIKKYYINAYRRNENEETEFVEEQQKNIEEAANLIQKMSTDEVVSPDEEIANNTDENNENNIEEQVNNSQEIQDKVFAIVGSILSLVVIGIVIIRCRMKNKKSLSKIKS